jgi:MFS family permease
MSMRIRRCVKVYIHTRHVQADEVGNSAAWATAGESGAGHGTAMVQQAAEEHAQQQLGGVTVLYTGCLIWSLATCAHAVMPYTAHPVATLAVLRFFVGLGSAAAVPGLASMCAQLLPPDKRPRAMSTAYGANSARTVPLLNVPARW